MLKDSTILVTGGTGSFGKRFVRMTLDSCDPRKIIIYSRDEMKQWEMQREFGNDRRLRFFLGDVRDKDRLHRAVQGVDCIVHAAALKIITTAEYNPFEFIKTNVLGAMNIIDCAIDNQVKRVIALSTDKACNPVNLYGATKLCSDKLFVAGNSYAGATKTRFAVVRYGNVMGSRGSIIPLFLEQARTGEITVTDEQMTRFMISLDQGVELVWLALEECFGGEIFVKKLPSMKVADIARTIAPNARIRVIGVRPGEKLHEQMISPEDSRTTYEYDDYYKILPTGDVAGRIITQIEERNSPVRSGKLVPAGFSYSSDTNQDWMSSSELVEWMKRSGCTPNTAAQNPITLDTTTQTTASQQNETPRVM